MQHVQLTKAKCIALLLLLALPFLSMANPFFENVSVKGIVTDASGTPLAGVTISIRGTNKSTVTNSNGEFNIDAEKGATLVISYVGFQLQEVVIGTETQFNITLVVSEVKLEEVVVTALGIKKDKSKISYATQEIKGSALDKAPESNIAGNLVGKVAGLDIRTKSNLFENPDIYLRGDVTLIVIDGVPTNKDNFDLWSLNANDIENIQVLKGTAAAALYGSIGINGAIMITTKKGKSGANGMEVTFNSSNQFQAGFLKIPKTQDQYGMGWNGQYAFVDGKGGGGWYDDYGYVWGPKLNVKNAANPSGFEEYPQYNSPYDASQLFSFTQAGYTDYSHYKPTPWVTKGKDNLKNFLNNELLTTNNVTVSGKTDKTDYRISFTHLYQKGQVPNTKLNSTTISLAGGLKVSENMKVEATLSYNKQYTPNYPQTGYGANNFFYNILLWMGPDVDIRDLKNYWQPGGARAGTVYGVKDVQQFNYNYTWYNNPWYLANEALNGYTNDVLTGQLNATYDFNKNLSFFARSGIMTNNSQSDIKTPWSYIYYGNGLFNGQFQQTRKNNLQMVSDVLLTYKKSFLKNFNATVSAGASTRYNSSSYIDGATVGLNIPALYTLGNSIGVIKPVNKKAERMVNSIFGYADIDYNKMVYLTITGRTDWTTVLQKPNNKYFYPSVSLGIIPSNMFTMPEFISFAKLRASWAQVSSDKIDIYGNIYQNWYATLPTYQSGPRWNGTNSSVIIPSTLVTNGLKPNTTISKEVGTELRFLKNRLGIDFTYFNYLDKNFIIQTPVSAASAYSSIVVNGDEITRKGIELVLSGTPVKTKFLKWDITANISTVHRWVKSYYGGDTIRNGVKVGERLDVYKGWTWEKSPSGEIVYGSNGFPQYINHVVNLGKTDPDYIFGFTNTISYKNLSIGFQFDGRIGGIMYNGLEQKLYEGGMHPETANSFRDSSYAGIATYTGQGVVITSGSATYDVQGNMIRDSRKFAPNTTKVKYIDYIFATYVNGIDGANLYKRSFIKLRELSLTYNAGPKFLKKTPFKSASISIIGRNLWLSTKVPFMDPDGYSGLSLPEPTYRNIGVNINLKF